jgi:VIT1/CCC1 family predicted Fe2+/Mn2+ transporter
LPTRSTADTRTSRRIRVENAEAPMTWLPRVLRKKDWEDWRERARESILDLNDGIVSAAGIAEGFAAAGVSTRTLVFAGATVVLAGGFSAAATRYSEERTEWEMNHGLLEATRASIEADPKGEFDQLVEIYEAKGLETDLAREVVAALTAHDPVAAHADAELDLESLPPARVNIYAALNAGLFYALGAAIPLLGMWLLPVGERTELAFVPVLVALGLTGWFASWLTGLPRLRLVLRNLVLGAATMAAGLLIGLAVGT